MAEAARSRYELRVVEVDERGRTTLKTLLLNLVELTGTSYPSTWPARVEVQIIERRGGEVVYAHRDAPETSHGMAKIITRDLDRLESSEFATEWGLDLNA